MISSTIKVAGCLFAVCLTVHAQNPAQKTQGSSISGKVTLKGSGVEGILVGARPVNSGRPVAASVATTDQQGKYRLSNLAPGQYEIMPSAPQFVLIGREPMKRVIIGEGENVENIDFTLVRGGVITGKVVDADGRPLIEEPVEVFSVEGENDPMAHLINGNATDDRGVYRIYGLAPGKYRVAAGVPEDRMYYNRWRGAGYVQTFYPSTNEPAKATLIEVTEGGEATNVDITLRRMSPGYTVTAKVVDADTGKPVADARYALEKFRENGSFATSGPVTNRLGEIKLENVTPGKYALYLEPIPRQDVYAEPVHFEVVDQDVKDLVIKTSSGGSVAGVILFEGVDEKVARTRFAELMLYANTVNQEAHSMSSGSMTQSEPLGADGSFRVRGLRPGTLYFSIWAQRNKGPANEYEVARIERDGMVQPNVEIKAREHIKGLRLFVRTRSGRIRGVVKFENGQVVSSRVYVSAKRVGEENFETGLQVDDRGHFLSEALAAGVYEVRVLAYVDRGRPVQTKQQVVVADNQVTDVTLTLDLKEEPGKGRP